MPNSLPRPIAEQIFAVLQEECGASLNPDHSCGLEAFCRYLANDISNHEFRFFGKLGSGGKFYNTGRVWRVSCYRESETPDILKMIDRANERLAALKETLHTSAG